MNFREGQEVDWIVPAKVIGYDATNGMVTLKTKLGVMYDHESKVLTFPEPVEFEEPIIGKDGSA